jgi:hypothetical protein
MFLLNSIPGWILHHTYFHAPIGATRVLCQLKCWISVASLCISGALVCKYKMITLKKNKFNKLVKTHDMIKTFRLYYLHIMYIQGESRKSDDFQNFCALNSSVPVTLPVLALFCKQWNLLNSLLCKPEWRERRQFAQMFMLWNDSLEKIMYVLHILCGD